MTARRGHGRAPGPRRISVAVAIVGVLVAVTLSVVVTHQPADATDRTDDAVALVAGLVVAGVVASVLVRTVTGTTCGFAPEPARPSRSVPVTIPRDRSPPVG